MVSTATSRLGLRKQAAGDAVNTWGLILDTDVFDLTDEAFGVAIITVSGDFTLTNTIYASNQARRMVLQLNGSPAAAFTATVPTIDKPWLVDNATAKDATIKMSSGTGAVVRAGRKAWVYSDGTNFWVNDPTLDQINTAAANVPMGGFKITGLADGAAATDAATYGQMTVAIATAAWSSAGLIPSGTLTGQVPRWTGAAYAAGAVDLTNSNAVTGILPATNLAVDLDFLFSVANAPA